MDIIDGGTGYGDVNYETVKSMLSKNTIVKWKEGNDIE